jgi:hypothetical protein
MRMPPTTCYLARINQKTIGFMIDWPLLEAENTNMMSLNLKTFIKRVWFYLSHRIDGRKPIKDACALSILSEDQIDDFDFSETIVRIKTVEAMKALGLRGPRNGYQYDGSIRYRSFKVEALERTKFLTEAPSWIEQENIKVPQITEQELLSHLPQIAEKHKRILETIWQNT